MKVEFVIPGRISGKQRPRFSRKTGTTYTPAKTVSQEAIVRQFASMAMGGRALLSGPVLVRVIVAVNHPASWSKKRKAATFYVTGKPDCDNSQKLIFDSMNGICFADDSQIAKVGFERRYVTGAECIQVTVEELAPVIAVAAVAA